MVNTVPKLPSMQILMATYNGERYLREQLDSILSQTYHDWKLLVHDDGSSDKTIHIIKEYQNTYPEKIILIEDGFKTGGAKNNFIYLMAFVKAQYIVLCDQDDIWLPNKLEIMSKLLKKYDLVVSDAIVVDSNKQILLNSFFLHNRSKEGLFYNLIRNSYVGCCMGFNSKIYKLAMPIPLEVPMHDWWLGMIAECFGSIYFINQPLILYRRHEANSSQTSEISRYSVSTKIGFRLTLIKYLILKWVRNTFLRR